MQDPDTATFIDPPDTLREKAQVAAGGVDSAALDKAEAVIATLRDDYLKWAAEDAGRLQGALEALVSGATDPETAKAELFRIAHDMKGQGGSFGYDLVTVVGDRLCRLLERIEGGPSPRQQTALRLHVEALRLIIVERLHGDGGPGGADLIGGLDRVADKVAP
jgi:chemotaxis protein histidine kinase CheA